MKTERLPPVNLAEQGECKFPYVCTLSDKCREIAKFLGAQETFRKIAENMVAEVGNRPDVASSLKVKYEGGLRPMRRMDIRATADGPIVLKCFACWNHDLDLWHIYVEGGDEDSLEKNQAN